MTKILIDEAVVRQAMEDFVVIKYGLEKSRIWGGVDWTYNPMHPVHYLPLRDKAEAQMESLNQALADAALDKMADNARELGLSYEQPAQEPDPDELTIAYMSGVYEGKKRKPLTDEQIDLFINGRGDEGDDDYVEPTGDGFGLTDADLVRLVRRVEAAHGIKGNT